MKINAQWNSKLGNPYSNEYKDLKLKVEKQVFGIYLKSLQNLKGENQQKSTVEKFIFIVVTGYAASNRTKTLCPNLCPNYAFMILLSMPDFYIGANDKF